MDLIYGLPCQTPESFEHTLAQVISLAPSRLALYGYAHVTWKHKVQKSLERHNLPLPSERIEILTLAIQKLLESGYRFVGMDHFALPDDELFSAFQNESLGRNFMGYTTSNSTNVLGLGVSAISNLPDMMVQNATDLHDYIRRANMGKLCPIVKGLVRNRDDRIRQHVIEQILCSARISFVDFRSKFGVDFADYFAKELRAMNELLSDRLITLDQNELSLTFRGRLLARNVARCFDKYRQVPDKTSFSQAI